MIKNVTPHINFSQRFDKQLSDASDEIIAAFLDTLQLFLTDPTHPALRNHALTGDFAGYRSIDVTEDIRAVFKETFAGEQNVVTFHLFGTHKQLYG
jgi:addiction module RelE/StbE family toxin